MRRPVSAVILALAVIHESTGHSQTQTARPDASARMPNAVQRVDSFDDIRAKTADELKRARAFDQYQGCNICLSGRRLTDFPDGTIRVTTGGAGHLVDLGPPPTPERWLWDQACRADAIAIGRPASRRALLNAEESYLFTDYSIDVDEWIRRLDGHDRTVTMSLPGGDVYVGAAFYSAGSSHALVLALGQRYVLFLKVTPADAKVETFGAPRALSVAAPQGPSPASESDDAFLKSVRDYAKDCPPRGR